MIAKILKILKTRNVFITGGGGVGKSYTINKLAEKLPIVLTSSTGISAVNISGQTIHSWAGIGIADRPIEQVVGFLNSHRGKNKKNEILKAQYLVIDEISMLNAYTFDYINEVLKQVRGSNLAFGGIRIIAVGDFYQLPPVKIGCTEVINGAERYIDYCFNSAAWTEASFETVHLTKVWRQNDADFIHALNNIRVGKVTAKDCKLFHDRNFPSGFEPPKEAVRLYGVNAQVDAENNRRFNEIKEKPYTFKAVNKIRSYIDGSSQMVDPSNSKLPSWDKTKYEQFDKDCRVPNEIVLKKGARVMLLKNLDFNSGLVNGSLGNVSKLDNRSIEVEFDNGETRYIETDTLELKEGNNVKISREQYPLRLAYASSIHRSQGQTFDSVFIDCSRFFECGQAYVALSRARTLDKMYLKNFDENKIFVDGKVTKFYEELNS